MNHMPNRRDKKTGQLYFAKIPKQGDKNMTIYSFRDELFYPSEVASIDLPIFVSKSYFIRLLINKLLSYTPYKHIFYQKFQKLIFQNSNHW